MFLTLSAVITSPPRGTCACSWSSTYSTIEATIRANSFIKNELFKEPTSYIQFYIRVVHVFPLQPLVQLHTSGEIQLPPLKQPLEQLAKKQIL